MVDGKSQATPRDDEGGGGEVIGRYTLHSRIAAGGMASVYLGSLAGAADFSHVVAIKRMHPHYATDAEFNKRFRSEAWLNSRILHPNVVQTLDVVDCDGELLLVMEYIHGVTLGALCSDARAVATPLTCGVSAGILVPVLHGLHAAHTAVDDDGRALGIVHRDFSPQNIIVGRDGQAKILDFGIARVRDQVPITAVGQIAGKYGYLAPEQIEGRGADQRSDIFAAGIVLWETLTGIRLFREPNLSEASVITLILTKPIPPPSRLNPAIPPGVDEIVLRALSRHANQRFDSARDMALALEAAIPLASPTAISALVTEVSAERLSRLTRALAHARRSAARLSRETITKTAVSASLVDPAKPKADDQTIVSAIPGRSAPPPSLPGHATMWKWSLLAGVLLTLCFSAWIGSGSRRNLISEDSKSTLRVEHPTPTSTAVSLPSVDTRASTMGEPVRAEASALASVPTEVREPPSQTGVKSTGARVHESAASRVSASRAARNTKSAAGAATKSMCDPPTYTDAEGFRHFKDGCL